MLCTIQNYISATEIEADSVKTITLNEVIIESNNDKKYRTDKLSGSLRIQQQLLETPQNIQLISAEILKDQFSLNVNESITRNVSGAFREELHNGISADIYMRGGYISAQRNGVDLRPLLKLSLIHI